LPERLCECGEEETKVHRLMECERYEEARTELRKKIDMAELSVPLRVLLLFESPPSCSSFY
jgi:hypothetical protein